MNTTRMEMSTPNLDDSDTPEHLIDIQWGIVERDALPSDLRVSEWVQTCLNHLEHPEVEVCVRIVEVAEIQYLNEHYRGKDKPTNVLSFGGSTSDSFTLITDDVSPMSASLISASSISASSISTSSISAVPTNTSAKNQAQLSGKTMDEHGRILLGDIIICSDIVLEEAEHQDKQIDAHFCHLLVHGLLHLQGYDHSVDDRAEEMEEIEKNLMQQFGYDDPYQ